MLRRPHTGWFLLHHPVGPHVVWTATFCESELRHTTRCLVLLGHPLSESFNAWRSCYSPMVCAISFAVKVHAGNRHRMASRASTHPFRVGPVTPPSNMVQGGTSPCLVLRHNALHYLNSLVCLVHCVMCAGMWRGFLCQVVQCYTTPTALPRAWMPAAAWKTQAKR